MIYALIAIGFTFVILIIGLTAMIAGGKVNRKFSSKLMSLRVVSQGIAILILACIYFFSQHSGSQ